ncbi:YniB family protein [Vibrio splendidus]
MKFKDLKNKARKKFWIGTLGSLSFGFISLVAFLKGLHFSFENQGAIGNYLSSLIGKLINFIYSFTDFIPFFWEKLWPNLPMLNLNNLLQESNYYFFALLAITLFFVIQLQESFWLKSKINKILREVEDEELKGDIKRQRGHTEGPRPDILELDINVNTPEPWFKKPLGLLVIGLAIAVIGKLLTTLLGMEA